MTTLDDHVSFVGSPAPRVIRTPDVPKPAKLGRALPWGGVLSEVATRTSRSFREHETDRRRDHTYWTSKAVSTMAGYRRAERKERRRVETCLKRSRDAGLPAVREDARKEALRREIDLKIMELSANHIERAFVEIGKLDRRRDLPSQEDDFSWLKSELPSMAVHSPLAAQVLAGGKLPSPEKLQAAKDELYPREPEAAYIEAIGDRMRRFPELVGDSIADDQSRTGELVTDRPDMQFGH